MKRYFITLCCLLAVCSAHAQTPAATPITEITGTVIDSATSKPLGYVTVALRDAKTSQPVKSTLTKDDGTFQLTKLLPKYYQLVLVFVGYGNKVINIKENKSTQIHFGSLKLAAGNQQLKEVSVTTVRPVLKREVDRITYDVQADPESKVQNVLDMLRKVPLLTVDGNDNIQLKGSGNYKILINGKESSLIAKNPSDVFKAMPAANIEKIEVITTPPAKYDAEGMAGIINIITKKNADEGYNVSINIRENTVWGPGANANGTFKKGKFGLAGYVGTGRRAQLTNPFSNTQLFSNGTNYFQNGLNTNKGHYTYGSLELSYEIDTLNLLTASIEGETGRFYHISDALNQTFDDADALTEQFRQYNNGYSTWNGIDLAVNYQLGFKRSKEQLLTFSYKYNHSPQQQYNDIVISDDMNYSSPSNRQYNNAGDKIHTFQLDYVEPFKKLTLEAGAKAILRNNFSTYYNDVFQASTNTYVTNDALTNDFTYHQNVFSIYNSYQLKLAKWTGKAGLRLEHTAIDADFTSAGTQVAPSYNNLIPSVSLQRTFKSSSINFGYTDRIQRPGIWQLNPFVDVSNPKFISTGNPNLRPELNHSLELNYSNFKKTAINIGLSYAFSNNSIQNVSSLTRVTNANGSIDSVTTTTYQNVGTNKSLGLNFNTNLTFIKQLTISLNGQLRNTWLKGAYDGTLYHNEGITGNAFMNAGYKFDKGPRLGINAGYYSGDVLLQGKSSNFIYNSFSVAQQIWNKKGTISFVANNPYMTYRNWVTYTTTPDYTQTGIYRNRYRNFNISFNYKFGKLSSDIKKNQRGINNDDTKGGGKSSGG